MILWINNGGRESNSAYSLEHIRPLVKSSQNIVGNASSGDFQAVLGRDETIECKSHAIV